MRKEAVVVESVDPRITGLKEYHEMLQQVSVRVESAWCLLADMNKSLAWRSPKLRKEIARLKRRQKRIERMAGKAFKTIARLEKQGNKREAGDGKS
jgi:hypothetical protein